MTRLSSVFPKGGVEPSWDRWQVARALRSQRHRREPLLKASQVLAQWGMENPNEYDARDLAIIAEQLRNVAGSFLAAWEAYQHG